MKLPKSLVWCAAFGAGVAVAIALTFFESAVATGSIHYPFALEAPKQLLELMLWPFGLFTMDIWPVQRIGIYFVTLFVLNGVYYLVATLTVWAATATIQARNTHD